MFGITLVYLSYELTPKLERSGIECKYTENMGENTQKLINNLEMWGFLRKFAEKQLLLHQQRSSVWQDHDLGSAQEETWGGKGMPCSLWALRG